MTMKQPTLAEELAHENELLRRRFVHTMRPKGPLTMEQARELAERMAGTSGELEHKKESP